MIRKWSYIIPSLHNNLHNTPLKSRFKFKVFRKTTRFKKYNLSYTSFIRKQVVLKKRRVGWKKYIILSSDWVKPLLSLKHLVSFTQNKSLYTNTTTSPYFNIFSKKSQQLNLVGFGTYALNHTALNSKMLSFFNKNNKPKKPQKFTSNVQFNSLSNLDKLSNLGFNFPNLILNNNYYPLKNHTTYLLQPHSHKINPLPTILSTITTLRSMCILIVLMHISK